LCRYDVGSFEIGHHMKFAPGVCDDENEACAMAGLYKLTHCFESAWFQPLYLKCDFLVKEFAFSVSTCTATACGPKGASARKTRGSCGATRAKTASACAPAASARRGPNPNPKHCKSAAVCRLTKIVESSIKYKKLSLKQEEGESRNYTRTTYRRAHTARIHSNALDSYLRIRAAYFLKVRKQHARTHFTLATPHRLVVHPLRLLRFCCCARR
jgi:ribosomal protein L33